MTSFVEGFFRIDLRSYVTKELEERGIVMEVSGDFKHSGGVGLPDDGRLENFTEMWYSIFIWCLGSSLFLNVLGALGAFFTLRKHKFGRFYSLMILFMGLVIPLSLGMISSAAIAFVYKTSNFKMDYSHSMMWGIGQTLIHAAFGATRILATL